MRCRKMVNIYDQTRLYNLNWKIEEKTVMNNKS